MSGVALPALEGELDVQILGLVTPDEPGARAQIDSTQFRTLSTVNTRYASERKKIHTGDCTVISGTLAFDCVRWKRCLM